MPRIKPIIVNRKNPRPSAFCQRQSATISVLS